MTHRYILSLILISFINPAFGMQSSAAASAASSAVTSSSATQDAINAANTLNALVQTGNSIAAAVEPGKLQKLTQVAADVSLATTTLDTLLTNIKAENVAHAKDPKILRFFEDIGVALESSPPLIEAILQKVASAEAANHPATHYKASLAQVKALHAKHAPAKK